MTALTIDNYNERIRSFVVEVINMTHLYNLFSFNQTLLIISLPLPYKQERCSPLSFTHADTLTGTRIDTLNIILAAIQDGQSRRSLGLSLGFMARNINNTVNKNVLFETSGEIDHTKHS